MKNKITFIFLALFCFSFVSCFQSEEAKAVDLQIKAIGPVTLESEEAILAAEKAVDGLLESDKKQLHNNKKLIEARKKYEQLVLQEKIRNVEAKINEIGVVSLDSEKLIKDARSFYDEQEQNVKDGVKNYETLTNAESTYSDLLVQDAITKIDSIGTDVKEYDTKLLSAITAYMVLSHEEKQKVPNAALVEEKITEYKQYKDNAKKKLKKTYDKMRDISFYEPYSKPQYATSGKYFSAYIGSTDASEAFRLVFNYAGDDWLFIDNARLLVDGERYTVPLSNIQREYVSYYSGLYEHADFVASDDEIEMVKKIINSKETIVRLNGEKYYSEFTLSDAAKKGIGEALEAYEGLKDEIYLFHLLTDVQSLVAEYTANKDNTDSANN